MVPLDNFHDWNYASNFGCLLDFHVCGIFSSLRGRKRYEAGRETMDLGLFISFDDAGNANTAE